MTWSDGLDDGSLPVIDYRVTVKTEAGVHVVTASSLLTKQYTARSLSLGVNYIFTVEARNSYGYSNLSEALTLLCAIKPSAPTNVLTTNVGPDALVTWTPGSANGSPITAYRIYIKTASNTYVEELTNCDGSSSEVVSS